VNIKVRKMDLSDISFVYEEEIKIFGKSLGEKTLYNEIMYNDLSRYFIALVDGKRVGYVGSWLTLPNAEILNLFVLDRFRGQKIGKQLMEKVVEVCNKNDIEVLSLEVNINNIYAINMYNNLGFKIGSVRKNYYDNKEDALLMIKELGGKK